MQRQSIKPAEAAAAPIIAGMVHLRRTVRFCLNDPREAEAGDTERHNGFAGWPPMRGLGRYYQLHVHCAGEPDAQTGYLINIKEVDRAFAGTGLPYLQQLLASGQPVALGRAITTLLERLQTALGGTIRSLRWDMTPFYNLTLGSDDMDAVVMRQQFDFSAAHRLHVPELSEEENRRLFGKCNNPAGHGHNYRLEVAVRAPIDAQGDVISVDALDALVDEAVIQKLDHKNLNVDVPAFAQLNPSVENIAKVIHGMLGSRVAQLGVTLQEVSVWETDKTVCTYRGD